MKKHLIAAAVAGAFAVPAMAQVTLGGSINAGLINTGAKGDKVRVDSLGGGANAINLSATEDLGGGMTGGFTGQIRFNAATGNMGSNIVDAGPALMHASNVFIGGGFGTVRLGKVAEAGNCGFDPWGCTGGAALSAGSAGVSALVGAGTMARSVSYATPNLMGFTANVHKGFSPKNGVTGGRATERQIVDVSYSAGPLSAQFLDVKGGATSGATPANDNSSQQSIGVRYNLGVAAVSFVNATGKAATTKAKNADIMSLGVTVPMGATTILAGYNKAKTGTGYTTAAGGTTAATSASDTKWAIGANYAVSKRTTLGADVFKAESGTAVTGSGAANGPAGTGYVVRARHTF